MFTAKPKRLFFLFISILFISSEAFSQLKAFPTAEGYGRVAKGGRGGRVIKVTNLNDAGPGSFRDALDQTGPRTIIFDVSGVINLKSKLSITGTKNNGFVTIAGQTAPGKGICLHGWTFGMIGGSNVIVRHIRTRIGTSSGETMDGMGMASGDSAIFDHCSISWTIDEAFSSRGAKNITLQRTLISEALNEAGHNKYPAGKQHGFAASISGDKGSFHHNLLAHCAGRNWSLAGGLSKSPMEFAGRLDIRNNVVYNWRGRTTDGGAHQVNFVNNYYKPGPAVQIKVALNAQIENFPGTQSYYFTGNVMPGVFDESSQDKGRKITYINRTESSVNWTVFVNKQFFEPYVTTQTAGAAYESVLLDVGCNRPMLDDHDKRIIQEVKNGTYTYKGSRTGYPGLIDNEKDCGGLENYPVIKRPADWDTDGDGMPNTWETARGLNPSNASDGNKTNLSTEGYTNLEMYLNELAGDFTTTTQKYNLTSSVAQGQGSVAPASGSYTSGQSVTVTATPASGWLFDRWGGDLSGSTNPATITMSANKTISAYFVQDTRKYYTITKQAAPGGSITQSPEGSSVVEGSNVTLTAVPSKGWTFSGWSGDHTGTNATWSISSLSSNVSVAASFLPIDKVVYQAENGVLKEAVLETKNAGYTGEAYVNYNAAAASIDIPVYADAEGEKTMVITFTNGSGAARALSVLVNGTPQIASLDFEATTDWATWQSKQVKLFLPQGASIITLATVNGQDGPNIDKIAFDQTTAAIIHQTRKAESVLSYNPAQRTLFIHNSGSKNLKVNIFSLNGKKVFSRKLNTGSGDGLAAIPLTNANSGVYLIKLECDGSVKTEYINLL